MKDGLISKFYLEFLRVGVFSKQFAGATTSRNQRTVRHSKKMIKNGLLNAASINDL